MGLPQAKASVREEFPPRRRRWPRSSASSANLRSRAPASVSLRRAPTSTPARCPQSSRVRARTQTRARPCQALWHTGRADVRGPRQFQVRQRSSRPRDRRLVAQGGHAGDHPPCPRLRRGGTAGWRRIRRLALAGRRDAGGDESARAGRVACACERVARAGACAGQRQRGAALLRADATPAEIVTAADRAMYARKDERRGLPAVDFPGGTN